VVYLLGVVVSLGALLTKRSHMFTSKPSGQGA
jgi:hypothetical protein